MKDNLKVRPWDDPQHESLNLRYLAAKADRDAVAAAESDLNYIIAQKEAQLKIVRDKLRELTNAQTAAWENLYFLTEETPKTPETPQTPKVICPCCGAMNCQLCKTPEKTIKELNTPEEDEEGGEVELIDEHGGEAGTA